MDIKELITLLVEEIEKIQGIDDRIDAINTLRSELHKISPMNNHPADFVEWVKAETIECNDYNPNKVAPPEQRLLIRSIEEDGYTMPIVVYSPEGAKKIIVDGFHRRLSVLRSRKINESTFGRLPVSTIRKSQEDQSNRMASTIRHNRARGTHDIDLMMNIVGELKQFGMSDQWIMKNIGMDADELLRLKQLSGLAEMFKNEEFGRAWE